MPRALSPGRSGVSPGRSGVSPGQSGGTATVQHVLQIQNLDSRVPSLKSSPKYSPSSSRQATGTPDRKTTVVRSPKMTFRIPNKDAEPIQSINESSSSGSEEELEVLDIKTQVKSSSIKRAKELLRYADGSTYEGYFENNKRCGKGVYKWKNGNSYDGDWLDDKRTGRGVYRFSTGNIFEGDFLDRFVGIIKQPPRFQDDAILNDLQGFLLAVQ